MTRVILYCDSPVAGGFEQLVGRFANALAADDGLAVELWYWHEGIAAVASHPAITRRRLAEPTWMPVPFMRAFNPMALWRVLRALRSRPAALVIVCQGGIELGARALIGARLARRPVISYLALAFDPRRVGARGARTRALVSRLFYALPASFITLSEFQRGLLAKWTDAPIDVVPMTIELGEVAPPGAPHAGPLELGVVGTVDYPVKGHDLLPGLLRACRARGRAVRLHVVGTGRDALRLAADLEAAGVMDDVVLHGAVSYAESRHLMRAFEVVLIPSRSEGALPLVAFEALAAGASIAVSDLASIVEWDVPKALRFDRDDPADALRAIEAALHFRGSPAYEAFRAGALATVAPARFDTAARSAVRRALATRDGSVPTSARI